MARTASSGAGVMRSTMLSGKLHSAAIQRSSPGSCAAAISATSVPRSRPLRGMLSHDRMLRPGRPAARRAAHPRHDGAHRRAGRPAGKIGGDVRPRPVQPAGGQVGAVAPLGHRHGQHARLRRGDPVHHRAGRPRQAQPLRDRAHHPRLGPPGMAHHQRVGAPGRGHRVGRRAVAHGHGGDLPSPRRVGQRRLVGAVEGAQAQMHDPHRR